MPHAVVEMPPPCHELIARGPLTEAVPLGDQSQCGNRTVRQDAVAEPAYNEYWLILKREKTGEEIRGDISWLRRRARRVESYR